MFVIKKSSHAAQRVALIISDLRPGGAERLVVHLSSSLSAIGVSTKIICLQNRGALAYEAEQNGVPVCALGSLVGYDLRAALRLARELRIFRPNIINVHDRSSLPYVVVANRLAGRCSIVLSCHGLLLADRERRRLRDRIFVRDVQAVTAVSDQAALEYARILDWRKPITAIPNGIPMLEPNESLRRTARSELGLPDSTTVFLAVGNVKPEKGYEDLLAAARYLRDHSPDNSFVVLVAGDTATSSYWDELRGLQKKLGLQETVRFLGLRSDTTALYAAADVFILSSRTEGLPMALLESMSGGLPVVATKVGAVPQVLEGDCGLLVDPARPKQLAERMHRLLKDDALRASLGRRARQRVAAQHSAENMARAYLHVYRQAQLARPGKHNPATSRTGSFSPKVLMLGPLPPLTGGMATVTANLRDSKLRHLSQLTVMNNGKTTPEDRSLWEGVAAQWRLLVGVIKTALRCRSQLAHVHTCALFSFWRDLVHMSALRVLGCLVVWHIHDGTFHAFISQGSRIKRAVIRWGLECSAAVIVLSEQAREHLRLHSSRANWRVVSNGVSVAPHLKRGHHDMVKFLFLGNMTRRKGAYDLIEATETAVARGAKPLVQIAGGEVLPGQRDEVARRIAQSQCPANFELLGLITDKPKDRALKEAECIVLPSYAEGLPMALLEGMSYGMPAIATCVGSIPELIKDGVEGFLIQPGDTQALSECIYRLATESNLRAQMGLAARDRICRQYSLDTMADKIMQVYIEVLGPYTPPGDGTRHYWDQESILRPQI